MQTYRVTVTGATADGAPRTNVYVIKAEIVGAAVARALNEFRTRFPNGSVAEYHVA